MVSKIMKAPRLRLPRPGRPRLKTWPRRFRVWSWRVLEIEGVILVAMLLIGLIGAGVLYQFTDFFGNKPPYEFQVIDDF